MPADDKTSRTSSPTTTGKAAAATNPERDKALGLVLNQIERNFGKGSIMRLGDASRMRIETSPTGALTLDLALGGGYPKGRVVEIYGPESSGKTTLTLHAIAEVQRRGGVAAFVDAEHALDPVYAAALGVDIENLLVSQPDTGEMALEIVDQLVRSAAVDIVVVDSVAALTPRAEIEGEMGDLAVGSQARLMSQAMRKITGNIGKSGCTVIFLNQLRQKIGVTYGNPETTTGGNALKFYASVRQGEGGQKQGGAAVPHRRVRHPVRPRHQQRWLPAGPGRGERRGGAQGRLVQLRRRQHRPGPRQHDHLAGTEP
jgi:recombination protein RecA